MRFPRQGYWSESPFPPPGDLPNPRIEPVSPAWQVCLLPLSHQGSPATVTIRVKWTGCYCGEKQGKHTQAELAGISAEVMWKLRLEGWEGASHGQSCSESILGRSPSECWLGGRNELVLCEELMGDQGKLRKASGVRDKLWTNNVHLTHD